VEKKALGLLTAAGVVFVFGVGNSAMQIASHNDTATPRPSTYTSASPSPSPSSSPSVLVVPSPSEMTGFIDSTTVPAPVTTTTQKSPQPTTQKPAPKPTTKPPAPKPTTKAPTNTSYKNCTEVWNKKGGPIHRGEPGYSHKLDNDDDGTGCEHDPRR
jgi:hypothetical protein